MDPIVIKLKRLMTIIVIWTFIGVLITVYDFLTIASLDSSGFSTRYDIKFSLLLNGSIGFFAAISGGFLLVFFINERFSNSPYWKSIILVALSYVLISSSLILFISLFQIYYYGESLSHQEVFLKYLFDPGHLKDALAWLIVVVLTQISLQVNDKFGQNNWINFLLGKYHSPKEETRIFMFVDLISSTATAEKLGNENYHRYLKEYYSDITDPILKNRGEIYQYVGDEVIISWKLSLDGRNDDCLRCYFDILQRIISLTSKYKYNFGLVPELKAGLHFGKVIVGEIGVIKRELTFSGDVLNTTSRIQGKCNELNVKILASDELIAILPNNGLFKKIPIGCIELRGKSEKVQISTIRNLQFSR